MFFKTNDNKAVAAYLQFDINQAALMAKAQQFADIFGGEPIFTRFMTTVRFSGLTFNKPMNNDIWCLPDPKRGGIRTLRARALKTECHAQLKQLKADWKNNYQAIFKDQAEVSHSDFLAAVGTSWGKLYSHSINYFMWDGFIYIKTDVALDAHCVEILGSEFKAAEAAKAAAQQPCQQTIAPAGHTNQRTA